MCIDIIGFKLPKLTRMLCRLCKENLKLHFYVLIGNGNSSSYILFPKYNIPFYSTSNR